MIKKLFTKYFLEVIPSIVATVVGAYIVTHYINAKSEADKPKAAISAPAVTSGDTGKDAIKEPAKKSVKADDTAQPDRAAKAEAAKKAADAKAAADKAAAEKAAADKVAAEKAATEKAAAEKLASDKAAAERRERAAAKAAPVAPPSAEANAAPDDKRDANDLARAAIERLRNATPRSPESHRAPDATARVEEPARQQERAKINSVVFAPAASPQPSVRPLPPAVTVAPPPAEAAIVAPPAPFPTPVDSSDVGVNDASRPMPPADIPPRSLDSRAQERGHSVAEGVVSAAKSVFQAVLPERN